MQQPPGLPTLPAMSILATLKTCVAALLATVVWATAQNKDQDMEAVDGPNVRVMRHDDGARTLFTRTPDNRTLTKKKFSANGVLMMLTVYRMDSNENPIGCRISDGKGNLLFKVSYGYRKSDGQLVEERMFDARVVRKDPNTGKEMPVRIFRYEYDTQGNRSAPRSITLIPGKTADEVYGPSALEFDPFDGQKPPGAGKVNPKARPVGGK